MNRFRSSISWGLGACAAAFAALAWSFVGRIATAGTGPEDQLVVEVRQVSQKKGKLIYSKPIQRYVGASTETPTATPTEEDPFAPDPTETPTVDPWWGGGNSTDPWGSGTGPVAELQEIVNLGRSVWELIRENNPVVKLEGLQANALPKGVDNEYELLGWKPIQCNGYEYKIKSLWLLTDLVRLYYRICYSVGGGVPEKSEDGKYVKDSKGHYIVHGKYIKNMWIDIESLDMAGGYDFNMSTTNTVLQDGGTPEDPTASMIITLQMELKGKLLYYKTFSDMYQIWGDGRFQDLQKITSGWEKKNPRPTQ